MHDEQYFTDPETFNPDHFFVTENTHTNEHMHKLNSFRPDDPSTLVFGFGRRHALLLHNVIRSAFTNCQSSLESVLDDSWQMQTRGSL